MGSSSQAPLLIRALRGEEVERTPVWFMRQAGRSLPEYRELRQKGTLLDVCRQPDLAAEITLQPVRRHGVDAAILFSDIVTPLSAIGTGVEIKPGVGPVFDQPIRSTADLERLRPFEPESDMPALAETVRLLVAELGEVPLVGFAGAPFTLASYLVEGGPSRQQSLTKALMMEQPEFFEVLLDRLATITIASLRAQIEAGVAAIQVFDSWVGTLNRAQFEAFAAPTLSRIFEELAEYEVPRIVFGVGTGHLLDLMAQTGADCVGVDWRIDLSQAREIVPSRCSLQGNLDPAALLAGEPALARAVDAVVASAPDRGHIFNLGHGVLPETDPGVPGLIVEQVRRRTSRDEQPVSGGAR